MFARVILAQNTAWPMTGLIRASMAAKELTVSLPDKTADPCITNVFVAIISSTTARPRDTIVLAIAARPPALRVHRFICTNAYVKP
jgi:hypothetical protein